MAAVSHDSPCGASLTRNTTTAVGKSSTADGAYLGSFGALSLADTRTALVALAHPRRLQSCSTPPVPRCPPGWVGTQMVCARTVHRWCVHGLCARTVRAPVQRAHNRGGGGGLRHLGRGRRGPDSELEHLQPPRARGRVRNGCG